MKNFYKIGKLKLWQKYCEQQRKKHPLTYLFWECTLKCNLSCRHCGSSCSPQTNNNDELSVNEIKLVFKSIAKDFNPKKIMIAVTGGEPLLRQDIFEVMRYANNFGFQWGMVTNGTLISPKIIKQMQKANMATISVSLDGTKQNHNWIRCNQNAFSKTIENIKLLAASKFLNTIEVITCVNQRNLKELEEIYQLCLGLGVDAWRLLTIAPVGRAKNYPELFLDGVQMKYLFDYIKSKRKNRNLKVSLDDEGFLGPEYEGKIRDGLFFCRAGINIGSILYNGDIGACPILPREHTKQGNIRQDQFSEVWNNKYEIFRNRAWRRVSNCVKCDWWEFCEGNSLHLWDFNNKKLMLCNYNLINSKICQK